MPKSVRIARQRSLAARLIMVATLLCCMLSSSARAAKESKGSPVRAAWLAAPKSGASWDREPLLKQILGQGPAEGTPRAEILKLLGPPGYSQRDLRGYGTFDIYRLSAANKNSYRIDYDQSGRFEQHAIELSPCDCPLCHRDSPEVSIGVLRSNGLLRKEETGARSNTNSFTIGELETLLGLPGKHSAARSQGGGQVWLNYSDTWRISDDPDAFFIASGHRPVSQVELDNVSGLTLLSWDQITFHPECLAPENSPRNE